VPVATVLSADGRKAAPAQGSGWSRKAQLGGLAAGVLVAGGLLGAGLPSQLGKASHAEQTADSQALASGGRSAGTMVTIAPAGRAVPGSHASGGGDAGATETSGATRPTGAPGGSGRDRAGLPRHSAEATGTSPVTSSPAAAEDSDQHAGEPGSHAGSADPATHQRPPASHSHSAAPEPTEQPKPLSLPKSSTGGDGEPSEVSSPSAPTSTASPTRHNTEPRHPGSSPVTVESPPDPSCMVSLLGIDLLCK
jgi:outer membrane biosynthesis protein TonB